MKNNIFKIITASVILIIFGLFSYGQAATTKFSVKISPEVPGPNKEVVVSLNSFNFDINRARIVWTLDGIIKLSGIGEKNFSFTVGEIGTKNTLSITVTTETGDQLNNVVVITPADIDILWEANTYTPENYKGKALPSSSSEIKVTAIPNFIINNLKIAPSKLIYEWEINYDNINSISGYGRQSFSYEGSRIGNFDVIKVTVSNYSRTVTASKTINIEIDKPKMVFYKEHPLEGIQYNKGLNSIYNLFENGIVLVAEPYFFSKDRVDSLSYSWRMNNKEVEVNDDKNKLNLTIDPEDSTGTSIIQINVSDNLNSLQFGKEEIKIKYNGDN